MNEQFNLFHYILYSVVLSQCMSHRDASTTIDRLGYG